MSTLTERVALALSRAELDGLDAQARAGIREVLAAMLGPSTARRETYEDGDWPLVELFIEDFALEHGIKPPPAERPTP